MENSIIRKIRALGQELGRELEYCALGPSKIMFDHIPKCGGTSLSTYLTAHYPKRKRFSTNGFNPDTSVEEFRALPRQKRYQYSLIHGHLAHELLDYVHPECIKVTILREPVDRIVSHYYHAKNRPSHYLHSKVIESKMSLEQYATSDLSNELRNFYTTHFSGLSLHDAERNPKESVEKAVDVLFGRYDIIGFLDNFSSFIQKLRVHTNLRHEYKNIKLNMGKDRLSLEAVPLSTRRKIEEVNHLDIDLYESVKANTFAC